MGHGVEYGLASSVWTTSALPRLAFEPRPELRLRVDQHAHFRWSPRRARRLRPSGYGKDLSMYGFEDCTRVKHVTSAL